MGRRTFTEEERAARRVADREFAKRAVEQLKTSDGWLAWLRVRAQFHRYSLANQLLIAMQMPSASRIAGFRAWLKLGYAVRRGERAVRIWVPLPPSKAALEAWERDGADPATRPRTHFKLGPVFDRSQVEPLPPPAEPVELDPPHAPLVGDELAWAWPRAVSLATDIGSAVTIKTLPMGQGGFYEPATKRIVISDFHSPNGRVAVLLHELAHALLRVEPPVDEVKLSYAEEELVVESVAFTVCRGLGLDSSSASIPYLAAWSDAAELATIERTAGLIDRIASRIEAALAEPRDIAAST
jgi:antirestriction protein ArdC